MGCDFLRQCHTLNAEFGRDSSHIFKVRWYKAKPGAKVLPIDSAFASPVWEPNRDELGSNPGMHWPPTKWRPSRYPSPNGQEYHGQDDFYLRGIPDGVFDNPGPHEHPICPGYAVVCEVFGKGYVNSSPTVYEVSGTGYIFVEWGQIPI